MKKLTKKSLDELAQTLPVIEETKQKTYVGGGDGTRESPYTTEEFKIRLNNDLWQGGFVEGMGYVANDAYVYGNYNSPLTVSQNFHTFPDYINSLSSDELETLMESFITGCLPPGFDVPIEIFKYLSDQYGNMTRNIQSELLNKGYNGTSSFTFVRTQEPPMNGSIGAFTLSVYDANTGEFITARKFDIFGFWNNPGNP
ncbi:MAG: hypothetical protein ACFN4S_02560 [Prevotella conceptionensis]|jgi:hypothetical protein|uniref:hypothetical protein n=1 Tax=Prevotella conceptionensis TaxID=340486 RepID=UPI0005C9ACFA|nr:hypothetical protein [Prevotella conceptionensis]